MNQVFFGAKAAAKTTHTHPKKCGCDGLVNAARITQESVLCACVSTQEVGKDI